MKTLGTADSWCTLAKCWLMPDASECAQLGSVSSFFEHTLQYPIKLLWAPPSFPIVFVVILIDKVRLWEVQLNKKVLTIHLARMVGRNCKRGSSSLSGHASHLGLLFAATHNNPGNSWTSNLHGLSVSTFALRLPFLWAPWLWEDEMSENIVHRNKKK